MKFYRTWPLEPAQSRRYLGRWGLCRLEHEDEAGEYVSEGERVLVETFGSRRRRLEWLGARAGLRRMLQEAGVVSQPLDCRIEKDRLGRPRMKLGTGKGRARVDVSLTHKTGLAGFCAGWSGTARVGMDLELVGRKPWRWRRAFATRSDSLLDLDEEVRYYSILWSCKEAASKALGRGLLIDFRRLIVSEMEPGKVSVASDQVDSMAGHYYLKRGLVAAIVVMPWAVQGNG